MNNKLKISLLFVILCCMVSTGLSANCTATIQDYIKYLRTPEPKITKYIVFQMSSLKERAKYLGYSSGDMYVAFDKNIPYLYAKDVKQYFSDRTWCPQKPTSDLICVGYQKFDYRNADTIQVSLFSNSTAKIVLTTWGNATYRFPLQCKHGFLYGTLTEPNGKSFVSFSLSKQWYETPR